MSKSHAYYLSGLILTLGANVSVAQSQTEYFSDPFPIVENLNVIVSVLSSGELSENEARLAALATCNTLEVAERDGVFEEAERLHEDFGYPDGEELNAVNYDEFVQFELSILAETGANGEALGFARFHFQQSPSFPPVSPFPAGQYFEQVEVITEIACDIAAETPTQPDPIASAELQEATRLFGKAVLGVAIVAVDTYAVSISGPAAPVTTGVFGTLSGSWGANRIGEAVQELLEIWGR